eukprot:1156313-Pelagomonas_calceolata.AAC.3
MLRCLPSPDCLTAALPHCLAEHGLAHQGDGGARRQVGHTHTQERVISCCQPASFRLAAQRGLVRVTVAPADKLATHVIITVEDTGIGISQDKIPHIWGAFEQVRAESTRPSHVGSDPKPLAKGTTSHTYGAYRLVGAPGVLTHLGECT